MNELQNCKKEITDIFIQSFKNGDFGPTEFDQEVNTISRHLISAYHEHYGRCFLGKINLYDKDRGNRDAILTEYKKQFIYNFAYSFIIPNYDQELIDLIYNRDITPYTGTKDDSVLIDAIFKRLESIGGLYLHWV